MCDRSVLRLLNALFPAMEVDSGVPPKGMSSSRALRSSASLRFFGVYSFRASPPRLAVQIGLRLVSRGDLSLEIFGNGTGGPPTLPQKAEGIRLDNQDN